MPSIPTREKADDRHLLGVTTEQRSQFLSGHVVVRASAKIATSFNGQLILWWLANLLARQFNVVRRIEFDVPSVPTRSGVALFGHQPGLSDTLVGTIKQIAGDKVVASARTATSADLVIHVGPKSAGSVEQEYAVWGNGWCCAAASALDLPENDGQNPVGPMLAATLGSAEAFQRITDWRGEGRIARAPFFLSAWDGKTAKNWSDLCVGPAVTGPTIEPFYLCGAGAVGQALVATLAYFPGREGHAVVLDGDPLDDSNLNRYCLSHRESPSNKPDACRAVLENATFKVDAVPLHWDKYTAQPLPRTKSSALNASEAKHKYRLIISCVDKNPARHDLQNMWPRRILGGSTSGLTLKVSNYDCSTGECLKCSNPQPTYPTIDVEAATLRKMSENEREDSLSKLSPEKAEAVRAYLSDPGCGHAAEQYLNELGEIRRREFSVGFVSVASGIFLAVALIQHALGVGELVRSDSNYFSFSFLNRKPGRHFFARDINCDCSATGGALFKRLWLGSIVSSPS